MAELIFTEAFVEDAAQIELASKREELLRVVGLLEEFPEIGSKLLPETIIEQYGENVRKLVVDPFDVIYEYDSARDAVYVLGLVHQRAAR